MPGQECHYPFGEDLPASETDEVIAALGPGEELQSQ